MDFKTRLVEVRTSKVLTQEELASKCNLTVRTIQRIESGQVQPRPHTIRAISGALEFDFSMPAEVKKSNPISWYIKDLFNLKTHKMRKISILSSSTLVAVTAAFLLAGKIQAQSNSKNAPKSGITINYGKDNSIERIDAVFTNTLTLDSLISISKTLREKKIDLTYRSMEFDSQGYLTGISCEVSDGGYQGSGSFSINGLDSLNKEKLFGFYYDYTADAESAFCAGGCW